MSREPLGIIASRSETREGCSSSSVLASQLFTRKWQPWNFRRGSEHLRTGFHSADVKMVQTPFGGSPLELGINTPITSRSVPMTNS
jgi:hypothetical protein